MYPVLGRTVSEDILGGRCVDAKSPQRFSTSSAFVGTSSWCPSAKIRTRFLLLVIIEITSIFVSMMSNILALQSVIHACFNDPVSNKKNAYYYDYNS
jgi:hypothetical protein